MKNKFWFLTLQSLKKKIATKWFVIGNIIICLAMVGITNLSSIIKLFGGDFKNSKEILVIDKTNEVFDIFKSNYKNVLSLGKEEDDTKIEKTEKNEEELKEELKDDKKVLIVFDKSENYLKAKITSKQVISSGYYQTLVHVLNSTKSVYAINKSGVDKQELAKISSNIEIERTLLEENANNKEENFNIIMSTVFPILILPFFVLVTSLVQMIGSEINEEKTTKSMEIIISNVSPKTHLFSKIISSNAFVVIQAILLVVYSLIAAIVQSLVTTNSLNITGSLSGFSDTLAKVGLLDKLIYIIPLLIIMIIASFLAYSLLSAILASMTVNMEDYQQVQTPLVMISLLGYYLGMFAGVFDGAIFIKVLAFVPYISALLAPALLLIGQLSVLEFIMSTIVLIIFNFMLFKYGLRIYKVGILNYSSDKLWTKLFKAIRVKKI